MQVFICCLPTKHTLILCLRAFKNIINSYLEVTYAPGIITKCHNNILTKLSGLRLRLDISSDLQSQINVGNMRKFSALVLGQGIHCSPRITREVGTPVIFGTRFWSCLECLLHLLANCRAPWQILFCFQCSHFQVRPRQLYFLVKTRRELMSPSLWLILLFIQVHNTVMSSSQHS